MYLTFVNCFWVFRWFCIHFEQSVGNSTDSHFTVMYCLYLFLFSETGKWYLIWFVRLLSLKMKMLYTVIHGKNLFIVTLLHKIDLCFILHLNLASIKLLSLQQKEAVLCVCDGSYVLCGGIGERAKGITRESLLIFVFKWWKNT